jgi:hypothetical protein
MIGEKIGGSILLGVLLALVFSTSAAAQSYKVESAPAPAPDSLAASVRDTLSQNTLRVTGPAGALCEIWLRKSLPAAAAPNTGLGIAFGQIAEGTLVGAIRFEARAGDYRQQAIQPGVYTLRYMLQPVDGNHLGLSCCRDYLLAVPAALDSSPADIGTKNLLALSRKASGTGHPSIWSLMPPDAPPASLPKIIHQEDGNLWVVFFQAPLASPVAMGLVIVGHAPES